MATPTPFELRPAIAADAGGIARTYIACWRDSYRGILPDSVLDGMSFESESANWRRVIAAGLAQHRVLVLNRPRGGVAGFLTYGSERGAGGAERAGAGEIFTFYVAPRHQGRGGGRRLMAGAAEAMRADGFGAVSLWVLARNRPARLFYEALGGVPAGERATTIGGARLPLVGYKWPALDELEEAAAKLTEIPLPAPLDRVTPGA